MTDREATLRQLAADLRSHDAVADAWLAKSFTDRLVVLDLQDGRSVPPAIRERLAAHDLHGSNEVYGVDASDASLVGSPEGVNRHQFVDVQSRGELQSYVVD